MKKGKYFIRFYESKIEVEGFIIEHLDRKFGIDKRDNGWCVTDIKTGLSVQPRKVDYFATKNESVEYLKTFKFEKFDTELVQKQLKEAEEKLLNLPIDNNKKI